jgi:hypothetical protein
MTRKRTTWVLDTETKGTGAEMIPLERLEERKRLKGDPERIRVIGPAIPESSDTAREAEQTEAPRRFKVVDVLSRQVLGEDVGLSEALQAVAGFDSVVDVKVYVWEPALAEWRPLTWSERRAFWAFRDAA